MQSTEEHNCQKIEYILFWQIFGEEMQEYKKCDGHKLLFTGCLANYPHCKHQQFHNEKENNWLLKLYLSCLSVYIFITLLLLHTSTTCFWLPEYTFNTGKYSLECNWYTLSPESWKTSWKQVSFQKDRGHGSVLSASTSQIPRFLQERITISR